MDYNGIDRQVWPKKSGPWIIDHGIDHRVWPTEGEPWTIVIGIHHQVWQIENGPWTKFSPWCQLPTMTNRKWAMAYIVHGIES